MSGVIAIAHVLFVSMKSLSVNMMLLEYSFGKLKYDSTTLIYILNRDSGLQWVRRHFFQPFQDTQIRQVLFIGLLLLVVELHLGLGPVIDPLLIVIVDYVDILRHSYFFQTHYFFHYLLQIHSVYYEVFSVRIVFRRKSCPVTLSSLFLKRKIWFQILGDLHLFGVLPVLLRVG